MCTEIKDLFKGNVSQREKWCRDVLCVFENSSYILIVALDKVIFKGK